MSAQPRVTIPRVEAWLRAGQVDYEIAEDGGILVDLENCEILIVDSASEFLVVGSTWNSEFDVVDPALMDYIDKHNSTMYAPRVVVGAYDDAVCLQADMVAFTGEGMSDAQLRGFLDSALTTLLSFYETAAEDLSDLVTRTEGD